MLLRFSLLTSARAGTLQSLGQAYGFQVLHLEFTGTLTVPRAAPRPPAQLRRVCGSLRVTDPAAFGGALRRRIGRHQACGHPEVGVLSVGAWAPILDGLDPGAPSSARDGACELGNAGRRGMIQASSPSLT